MFPLLIRIQTAVLNMWTLLPCAAARWTGAGDV